MKKRNKAENKVVQLLPAEKIVEFKHMSLRARLMWLEEANTLLRKAKAATKSAKNVQ